MEKDWNLTNNVDNQTVVVIPLPEPSKTVNNTKPYFGFYVDYNLTVTNTGDIDYIDVLTVIDRLPVELIFNKTVSIVGADLISEVQDGQNITWKITNISANSKAVITVKVLVLGLGKLTNNLTVVGPNGTNKTVNCTIDPLPVADLEVIKVNDHVNVTIVDDTEIIDIIPCYNGDIVNWTITVKNNGPNDAENVIVTDILPEGLIYVSDDSDGDYDKNTGIWTVGDLANGESRYLTIVTQVCLSNITITNPVNVTSDTYDVNESNNKDNSSVYVEPEADLEVSKLVSNAAPHKNDRITWSIIVINNGADTAVNTVVVDKLPSGLVYVSDNSNGAYDVKTGIWTVGDLANGEVAVLNIVTIVKTTNATIINTVNVTSDTYDPNEDNNQAENETYVAPEADLILIKDVDKDVVKVGDKVKFTIAVINLGPDSSINVRVHDVLPKGLKLISFKVSKGSYNEKTGVWNVGDMKPNETVTITIVAEALFSGHIVNSAYVESDTYDPDVSNNNDTAEVTVEEPDNGPNEPSSVPPSPGNMHATGNPIAMVILALLSIAGASLRRKN